MSGVFTVFGIFNGQRNRIEIRRDVVVKGSFFEQVIRIYID